MANKREEYHVAALADGKMDSFRWIYQHHHKDVYNFCLSFTKSTPDAEEITSDAFLQIWKKRACLDCTVSLRPLLFKITRDLTWNHLKKMSRVKERQIQFLRNYVGVTSQDAAGELIYQEYLRRQHLP